MKKKFIGYLIIGSASRKEAEEEKGLMLWMTRKPSLFVRLFDKWLLKIYWVDRERILEDKGKKQHPENENVEFRKTYPPKYSPNKRAKD